MAVHSNTNVQTKYDEKVNKHTSLVIVSEKKLKNQRKVYIVSFVTLVTGTTFIY